MALPLPPSSNLHSILLVTKSRSLGPRLVFHYPPISPSAADLSTKKAPVWFGAETSTGSVVDSNSSSSDWDSSTENDGGDDDIEVGSRTSGGRGSGKTVNSHRGEKDGKLRPGTSGAWGRQENIDEEDADNGENGEGEKKDGSGKPKGGDRDWDSVLGFKIDALEKMLCPERAFNKRKFELGVEGVVFVGAPMFVRDDGLWKKMKKRRRKSADERAKEGGDIVANLTTEESDDDDDDDEDNSKRPPLKKNESFIFPPGFEPGYGHGMMSGAPSIATSEAGSETRSNSTTYDNPDMTMFNVVFVLNPPALEYQLRVKDIYDNVTKKYAKALKYEQARFQYVWSESKRIIDIKQRAKEGNESLTMTWQKIIGTSPLAKSIATLFEAVSNDRIAHIHFDASFNSSFQIPQADSTPYLPNALEPQMPGLWLTTSNVVADDDDGAPMTQHAALLLLEDPDIIIKDLQSSGDKKNAAILAYYIRSIVPTKSLLKISTKHNFAPEHMEYIATHLVYWRRARLIAPLHPRDTYIVSPNADLSRIQPATAAYAARFSTLPSLPKMLSLLSGTPKPYRAFIPTSEHKDAYMEILAWLMRGGWVTQLRTFAWVRVSPEIKRLVAIDIAKEEMREKERKAEEQHQKDLEAMGESLLSNKRTSFLSAGSGRSGTPLRRTRRGRDRERDGSEDGSGTDVPSPRIGPSGWRGSPVPPGSDAGSASSARTTIPYTGGGRPTSPAQLSTTHPHSLSQSHSREHTPHPNPNIPHRPSPLHLKTISPARPSSHPFSPPPSTALTHPHPPHSPHSPLAIPLLESYTPSLILNPQKACSLEARWLEKIGQSLADNEEVKKHWPMLLRYFDGVRALNDICPREGLKRKEVSALIAAVREGGWLVFVRHW